MATELIRQEIVFLLACHVGNVPAAGIPDAMDAVISQLGWPPYLSCIPEQTPKLVQDAQSEKRIGTSLRDRCFLTGAGRERMAQLIGLVAGDGDRSVIAALLQSARGR